MGAALCLLSAACFGAMAVFGKLAYAAGVTPDTLVLLRFTGAAALLATLLALRPDLRTPRPAPPADRPAGSGRGSTRRAVLVALGLGAVGYATQASLYFAALQRVDASLVALVLYTYPPLVTVAAALLGRERLTRARTVALGAASAGTLLVLAGAGGLGFDPVGVGLAFGAAVTYTGYILVADTVVTALPPVVLAALVMTGAALALAGRATLTGGLVLGFGPAGWFWVACITVVSTVLAVLAFFAGLRRTGASTASILSTFEPVVSTALAALVLGEVLSPVQTLGAGLVLASAVAVQRRSAATDGGQHDPPINRPRPSRGRAHRAPPAGASGAAGATSVPTGNAVRCLSARPRSAGPEPG